MSYQRLLRFLPDVSHLLLLAGVLVIVFGVASFANLAFNKSEVLADQQRVRYRLEQLQEQNRRLKSALEQGRQGQHIPYRAWQYFSMTPPGVTMVEPERAPVQETAQARSEQLSGAELWVGWWKELKGTWVEWRKELGLTLTNLRKQVEWR